VSHSKLTGRGRSLYLEKWNPSAQRFIVTCVHCARTGFRPEILEDDFAFSMERQAVLSELQRVLKPLPLDAVGRCKVCAGIEPG
jgi:hypothetical protein